MHGMTIQEARQFFDALETVEKVRTEAAAQTAKASQLCFTSRRLREEAAALTLRSRQLA